ANSLKPKSDSARARRFALDFVGSIRMSMSRVGLANPAAASACAPTITNLTPRDVRQDKNSLKSGGSSGGVIHSPKHLDGTESIHRARFSSALPNEALVVAQGAELECPALPHHERLCRMGESPGKLVAGCAVTAWPATGRRSRRTPRAP